MKETKNTITPNDFAKQEALQSGAFMVPDNYFDDLENSIINATINKPQSVEPSKITVKKLVWSVSIAASLIIGILFANHYLKTNTLKPSQIIVEKTNSQPTSINKNGSNEVLSSYSKDSKNKEIDSVNKVNTPYILEGQKNKSNVAQLSVNQKQIFQNNQANSTGLNNTNQNPLNLKNTQSNSNPIANSISNSISNTTSQNNNTNSSAIARLGNESKLKLFGSDTCGEEGLMLKPTKIDGKKFQFEWSTGETTNTIKVSESGTYWLKAYNENSIIYDSIQVKIIQKPEFDLKKEYQICAGERFVLDSKLSNPNYTYLWSLSSLNQPSLELLNLKEGLYKIKLQVLYCNLIKEDNTLLIVENCNIHISNVITPNNDGYNDKFEIEGLEKFPGSSLKIMDRSGKIIFESRNYTNDWNAENIADGTYFYYLKLNNSGKTEKSGSFTIIR